MKFFAVLLIFFVAFGAQPTMADSGSGGGFVSGLLSWLEEVFGDEGDDDDEADDEAVSGGNSPGPSTMSEEELEAEATALAQQIAASAAAETGSGDSERYHDYAKRLALTLSQLDSGESNRVFGD